MRASAEDGETAALMGIRQGRVSALAWVVAGVLAAVAALFLVGSPTPGVTPAATPSGSGLPGRDPRGPGLPSGRPGRRAADRIAEALAAGYQDQLLFLGRGSAMPSSRSS